MKKQMKAHNNAKNIEMETRARDGFLNQKKLTKEVVDI